DVAHSSALPRAAPRLVSAHGAGSVPNPKRRHAEACATSASPLPSRAVRTALPMVWTGTPARHPDAVHPRPPHELTPAVTQCYDHPNSMREVVSMQRLLLGFLSLLAATTPLAAQVLYGSLTGIVHDPAGAVVPAAAAKVQNIGTGQEFTTQTND